jgi:hypothetical protein
MNRQETKLEAWGGRRRIRNGRGKGVLARTVVQHVRPQEAVVVE